MEQNKNPTASPKTGKPETPLTEEQRQKRRKMLVYPLMGLLFLGSMWLIFAPSEKEKAEAAQGTGFNTEMPLPAESGIIADKRTAYEQARMEEKQKERRAQMHDLADLFADKEQDKETAAEDFDLLNPEAGHPYGVSMLRSMPYLTGLLLKIYDAMGKNWTAPRVICTASTVCRTSSRKKSAAR